MEALGVAYPDRNGAEWLARLARAATGRATSRERLRAIFGAIEPFALQTG